MNNTAYNEPIAEAGNRIIPFLIESVTVGSNVTIAVITAKTGGQPINLQINAVKNTATAVLTIRFPGNRMLPYTSFLIISSLIILFNQLMYKIEICFIIKLLYNN